MYRGEYRLKLAKNHSEWAVRSNEPDDCLTTGIRSNPQLLDELDLLLKATDVFTVDAHVSRFHMHVLMFHLFLQEKKDLKYDVLIEMWVEFFHKTRRTRHWPGKNQEWYIPSLPLRPKGVGNVKVHRYISVYNAYTYLYIHVHVSIMHIHVSIMHIHAYI